MRSGAAARRGSPEGSGLPGSPVSRQRAQGAEGNRDSPGCWALQPRRQRDRPRGLPALTIAVEQLQAVVDPVVGLFAVGFLKSKATREAGGKRKTVSMRLLHHSHARCPRGWMGQLSALSPGIARDQGHPLLVCPPGQGKVEAAGAPGTSRCRGPGGAERGGPRRGGRAPTGLQGTHLLLLHEAHEGGALDLHGLPLPVVQSQDEVEKVGLPQVGRRLLLEVSPGQTHSAGTRDTRVSGSSDKAASRPPQPVPSPAGTRLGPPGQSIPPSPEPPWGFSLRARRKTQTPNPADPQAHPVLRRARSPQQPHQPSPVPTSPARGPCPLAAGPAWRGSRAQSRRRVAPRSSIAPATSQTRLGAVTAAPMCLILRAFPPAPERWINTEPRRQLQIFQGCPCRNFPFLRGLQREGAGRGGRHREMSTLN